MSGTLPADIKQYFVITGNYWAFTLTDGALRMLVVLYFHELGYAPLQIAFLFLFYEIFGVVTNLIGGWLGARLGLNRTMNIGLFLQIVALSMLVFPIFGLTIPWVMAAQALSGIAKDLNKMSAKSAIKIVVPSDAQHQLFKWVAILTGSKNALKGAGFFLGGALLAGLGFTSANALMAIGLALVWLASLILLKKELGRAKNKPKFSEIFSKSRAINYLSAARLFLFGARDVWFVVALPVFMAEILGWSHWGVGSYLALWVIGYGAVQSATPYLTGRKVNTPPGVSEAFVWALFLIAVPILIAGGMFTGWNPEWLITLGLAVFGFVFAINSSLHSYLIVAFANEDGVSLDVGFYYMANAMGRLMGTVLSGWVYQEYGLVLCLVVSASFISMSALCLLPLRKYPLG
ncbi:MAG: putative MFS family arabinose efflux permease [Sneathiella sp.]|jgi:predicted MFS family arabinose efflux permease